MVLTFKFDESYKNSRSWVVGGWIGTDRHWAKLQRRWLNAIAYENRTLPEGRKISRYHATDMNNNNGDFEGWESEGYRKLRLTKKLLKILGNSKTMSAVAVGMNLKAFHEAFPHVAKNDYAVPYILCMRDLMILIGKAIEASGIPDARVAMVHEHNDWDKEILFAFNRWIDDPQSPFRDLFVSITPMNWRTDVGLQCSDLIAYEIMRRLDDQLWTGRDLRKPLQELLRINDGGVYGAYMDKDAITNLAKQFINWKNEDQYEARNA